MSLFKSFIFSSVIVFAMPMVINATTVYDYHKHPIRNITPVDTASGGVVNCHSDCEAMAVLYKDELLAKADSEIFAYNIQAEEEANNRSAKELILATFTYFLGLDTVPDRIQRLRTALYKLEKEQLTLSEYRAIGELCHNGWSVHKYSRVD